MKKMKKEEEVDPVKEDSKSEGKGWFKTEEGARIPLQQEAENDLSSNQEEVCKVENGLVCSQEAGEVIKVNDDGLSSSLKECGDTSKVANGVSSSQEPGWDAIKAENGLPSNGDVPHFDNAGNGLSSNQEPGCDAIKADNGLPSNGDVPHLKKAGNGLSSNQEPGCDAIKADNGLPSNLDVPHLDKADNNQFSNHEVSGADHQG